MSAYQLFTLPKEVVLNASADVLPGAKAYFYATTTTTPQDTYTTSALNVAHPNPVVADANGVLPPIYLNPALLYKLTLTTAAGVLIYTVDPVNDQVLSQSVIGGFLYPQTVGEIAASVTPTNYYYPPGHALRYGNNATPGTTDTSTALQAAVDSADQTYPAVHITHRNAISKPLLIRSTSVQNLAIVGEGRTVSIIEPTAVDIKQAAQNINCLIFNQCDNGHLYLNHVRFYSAVAFTGHILYCVEGGGTDLSGQALFSCRMEDVWCSLSSQNTGYFRGGFSNLQVNVMTCESVKDAVFILEGAGNGDLMFSNIQMFICYDNFIRASDAFEKSVISIMGLHAYNHQRGRLLEFNNTIGLFMDDIILEPDAANLGDCGIFKLTDCANVMATNFSMRAHTGVPNGEVGIDIINGCKGKFSNGVINATTGLKFSGAGVLDLTFENVDFTDCTMCWTITGTQTGRVRFINCKLNNAQQRCVNDSAATAAFDVEFIGGEIKNAGLGGNAGFRNIIITSSGNWIFRGTLLGQDSGSAVAAYYVDASGSGSIKFFTPYILGTPPTGLKTGAQATLFDYERGFGPAITAAASIDPGFVGDTFLVNGNTGIGSIQAASYYNGRRITLIFTGTPTVTDGSNLKLSANLVATADDSLTLVCDGTNWYEVSRSVN